MRLPAALALVGGLAGCDNLFNLERIHGAPEEAGLLDSDSVTADGFVPSHCSMSPFPIATPIAVPELRGIVAGDPAMTADRLQLFFVKTGPSPYEIWRATRTAPDGVFEVDSGRELFNIDGVENVDPSVTLDAELLVFVSTTTNGRRAFFTEHADGAWTPAAMLPGLESATVHSASISWDGLVIYFEDATGNLLRAQRNDRASSFGNAVVVRAAMTAFPAVSADELEVFANTTGIGYASRSSTSVQFGGLAVVLPFGKDPQLSPDARTMVIAYDTSIAVLERLCN